LPMVSAWLNEDVSTVLHCIKGAHSLDEGYAPHPDPTGTGRIHASGTNVVANKTAMATRASSNISYSDFMLTFEQDVTPKGDRRQSRESTCADPITEPPRRRMGDQKNTTPCRSPQSDSAFERFERQHRSMATIERNALRSGVGRTETLAIG